MKQILSDFKGELEQNLDSAADTLKAEPKKFFQSAKAAVTGKPAKQGNDFGKALEKMATSAQGGQTFDPLVGDKPAPSKKMMAKISDMTAAVASKRKEELRKRFEQIRAEAINPEETGEAKSSGGEGKGPEVKIASKKLSAIQQNIKNAQTTGESRDGGMG